MPTIDYEKIGFDDWKKWTSRQIPFSDFDVPEDFGIFGIYVLGDFSKEPTEIQFDPQNMPAEVFYIGMSRHVDQRLAKSHKAVSKYRKATGDHNCKNLWYVKAYSEWFSFPHTKDPVASSYIEFYERALVLQYVLTHKKLPIYNMH